MSKKMINGNDFVELLGKSEQSEQVKKILAAFEIKHPLQQPGKGEKTTHVELKNKAGIELVFKTVEDIFPESEDYAEGELILHTVFFYPKIKVETKNQIHLPYGLEAEFSRFRAYEKFGKPDWSRDGSRRNSAKWDKDEISLHIEFDKEEDTIQLVTISIINEKRTK